MNQTPIPETQHAIQITGVDQFIINPTKRVDEVGPHQMMLKVEACGICFSDTKLLHAFDGHPRKAEVVSGIDLDVLPEIPGYKPGAEAVVPGHEPVGRIVAAGPADAPVSVVVYSDYSCPYCQSWSQDTQPAVEEYAERGDVRLEWRDVSILGEESTRAATAAAAAAQQDAYWEYHEALFANMSARSEDQLIDLARGLDLDVEQFTDHLTDPNVLSLVQANMQEAQALGLQSTPSFIVGGTPVVGAQPTEVFVQLIEQALAE